MRTSENLPTGNFLRIFLPYCIEPAGDGTFLVVNRDYKPIGILTDEWVTHEGHPARVRIKDLTPARAVQIGLSAGPPYYLYEDSTAPDATPANWRRYENILRRLQKLVIESPTSER